MLIFVYGDDTFRVKEKVNQITKAFREKFDPSGINTSEFPQEGKKKIDVGEVIGSIRALPFLGDRRMVVVRDLLSQTKKPEMKIWLEGLSSIPETSIVVFWEVADTKSLEKKPLYKELIKLSQVHTYTFPQLSGAKLSQWVQGRVKDRDGAIQGHALRALVERVGPDLWQMDTEIAKLVAYANGVEIDSDMVDSLVQLSFEGKIFQFIDAISQRRPKQAIKLLQEERWSGANNHYLLTMIGRQVRILLGARASLDRNPHTTKQEFAAKLGVHPFVAQKALLQAKGFSLDQLKLVHQMLYEYDLGLKTGLIDSELAVDLTMVELMK
jgi:DNA polymerase III subunit delta